MSNDYNALINELKELENKRILNNMRVEQALKNRQAILYCLYELKKEIVKLRYELINYYPERANLEKACIIKSCDFMMDKFSDFEIPHEAKEFYV